MRLVTQLENQGCLRACLAMIAGVEYADVPEHCGWSYNDALGWLRQRGIESKPMLTNATPREGSVYIVCSPSLNLMTSLHAMVWDCRLPQSVLLDPNSGREGKKAYPSPEYLMRINQWRLDYEVLLPAASVQS